MRDQLSRFAADERGNFSMLLSLSAFALALMMGLGLDYYSGLAAKSRLEAAADAAALATVNAAKTYYAQNSGKLSESQLETNAKAAGKAAGLRAFAANVGSTTLTAPITPNITPTYANLQFSASVQWSGSVQSFFGSLVGVNSLALGGTASAISQLPLYEDFYVLTDVSGSMGIPTSNANQTLLMQTNPDNSSAYPTGCQFACHFAGYNSFAYTQQSGNNGGVLIPLKLNDVGTALNNLLATANGSKVIANQFRVGIYTYIDDAIQAAALSSDLTPSGATAQVASNLANFIDAGGANQGMGSGGTHFDQVWNDVKGYFNPVGDGSASTKPKPFVILITDGISNNQVYNNGAWTGSQPVMPDSSSAASLCTQVKNLGYTVAVLLIPYDPILNPQSWFANNEDGVVNYYIDQTIYSKPSNAQQLAPGENVINNMQSCASPGYFFSASSSQTINAAMQQIFYQASSSARLTQ